MKKISHLILIALLTLPFFVQAQYLTPFDGGQIFNTGVSASDNDPRTFGDFIRIFIDLIKLAFPVMIGLALLVFFKGLIAFIAKSGDAKSHEEGRSLMIWGVIALFIMVSVFGILRFFYGDLGFDGARNFGLPLLPHADSPDIF